jgi:hypothetical protein
MSHPTIEHLKVGAQCPQCTGTARTAKGALSRAPSLARGLPSLLSAQAVGPITEGVILEMLPTACHQCPSSQPLPCCPPPVRSLRGRRIWPHDAYLTAANFLFCRVSACLLNVKLCIDI